MNDDQFMKLFKYMEKRFDEVDDRFDNVDRRIDSLTSTIDAFVKRLDDAEIEQVSRDAQFNRLLDWAREVSKKTGVPLPKL